VRRREFITLLGGAAAVVWPLPARAQQAPRAARLGYLAPASNPDLQQALLGGLRDLGYVEGHNLANEYRLMLGQSKTYDELRRAGDTSPKKLNGLLGVTLRTYRK
jgi:putative tryptophan/tyrosine transport system substrate-binding protein